MARRNWRWGGAALAGLLLILAAAVPAPGPRVMTAAAPAYTVTRYVSGPDPARYYDLGCAAGQAASAAGPASGIVILDFGQPRAWNGGATFGTYDFGNHLDSIATITAVSEGWLKGFWDCTPNHGPFVRLAVGTSNYQGATTYGHGQAWANMINEINTWIRTQGYSSQLLVRGANDMEVSWNTAAATRAWIDGYNDAGRYPLYDYGDDEGGTDPPNGWTAEDVWYKAYGARLNNPVPEIYYKADATLDWQPLSLWAYRNKGAAIAFLGTLTQYAADSDTLSPPQGWEALRQTLNSDRRTAQAALPYATDITWAQTASGAAPTGSAKGSSPAPPPSLPTPAATLGLLAADVGPVPVPGRAYTIVNKWLGQAGGRLMAVYAGHEKANPKQGLLVVWAPGGDTPPRIMRAPGPVGPLKIVSVDGTTVTLTAGPATHLNFDLMRLEYQESP